MDQILYKTVLLVKTRNLHIISNIHIYLFLQRIKNKENLNKLIRVQRQMV